MVLILLPACAWQNPENRILWDAFETRWVPENEPAASLALPLTVPAGIVAILLDVTVVHPALVIDDAFEDASAPWKLKSHLSRSRSHPVQRASHPCQ